MNLPVGIVCITLPDTSPVNFPLLLMSFAISLKCFFVIILSSLSNLLYEIIVSGSWHLEYDLRHYDTFTYLRKSYILGRWLGMVVERVELVGGTHPGGREEPAGGTHPSALRAPWNMDREECMWAGPTQYIKKISSTWSCVPGSTWSCITGALILPHCYCNILY